MSSRQTKHIKCTQCEKAYSRITSLYLHVRSSHEGIKYPCALCDFVGNQKVNLQEHIVSKHEDTLENPPEIYVCAFCDYTSKIKKRLRKHEIIHKANVSDLLVFCAECGKTFKHLTTLRAHEKIIHKIINN